MTTSIGGITPYLNPSTQSIDPNLLAALLYLSQAGSTATNTGGGGGGILPSSGSSSGAGIDEYLLNYLTGVGKAGTTNVISQLLGTGDIDLSKLSSTTVASLISLLPALLGPDYKYLYPASSYLGSTAAGLVQGADLTTALLGGIPAAASGLLNLGLSYLLPSDLQPMTMAYSNVLSPTINAISSLAGIGNILPAVSPILSVAAIPLMAGLNFYNDLEEEKAKHEYEKDTLNAAMINYKQNEAAYDQLYNIALADYLATGGVPIDEYKSQNPGIQPWPFSDISMQNYSGLYYPMSPYGQPGMVYQIDDPILAYMLAPDIGTFRYEPDVLGLNKGAQLGFSTSPAATMYYDPYAISTGINQMLSGELTPEQIMAEWESYGLTPQQEQYALMMGSGWNQYNGPINPQNMANFSEKAGVEIDPFVYSYMIQKNDYDKKMAQQEEEKKKQEYYSSYEFQQAYGGA